LAFYIIQVNSGSDSIVHGAGTNEVKERQTN